MTATYGKTVRSTHRWRHRLRAHVRGNPTGLAVTWLGTSSGAPTITRNNSSIALRAGADEVQVNPRARSAVLRVAERLT